MSDDPKGTTLQGGKLGDQENTRIKAGDVGPSLKSSTTNGS